MDAKLEAGPSRPAPNLGSMFRRASVLELANRVDHILWAVPLDVVAAAQRKAVAHGFVLQRNVVLEPVLQLPKRRGLARTCPSA